MLICLNMTPFMEKLGDKVEVKDNIMSINEDQISFFSKDYQKKFLGMKKMLT